MYIVRDSFTAKPGQASKLAALFKEVVPEMTGTSVRILTDAVGPYNTVEMEMQVDDLAAFEERTREYGSRDDIREKMAGYTDMYLTGHRAIFRVM